MKDADAEVEPVEDSIPGEEDPDEEEPDGVEIREMHGGDYSEARPLWVKISSVTPRALV